MRITKTPLQHAAFENARKKANTGCGICPCCGETKSTTDYIKIGILNKGVRKGGLNKTWADGIFHMRNMKCDCYKCYSCGAEWESEPYQWS